MSLSIDGPQQNHDKHRKFLNGEGSYNIIFNKLDLLKSEKISFVIAYTVTPDTIEGLKENLLSLVKYYTVDLAFMFDIKPIGHRVIREYRKEILKFLSVFLKNKLFLESNFIYPFQNWFRTLLFNDGQLTEKLLITRCLFKTLRLLPNGEIIPCNASFYRIPHYYRKRFILGNVDEFNYSKLQFLREDLDLSELTGDKKIAGCNMLCLLQCEKPANRLNFEKKIKYDSLLLFKKYIDSLDKKRKDLLKDIIHSKLSYYSNK